MKNVLTITSRAEFREWLMNNSTKQKECWISLIRTKPRDGIFTYLDAVEESLCFGWIDSTQKVEDGICYQRFSPRTKRSPWTELNKERVRRLEKLGLMTKYGRKVLPKMGPRSFIMDPDIETALKKERVWTKFKSFHPLYQRVRAYNVSFYKTLGKDMFEKALTHLIEETKKNNMYGNWNDYGRLLDY